MRRDVRLCECDIWAFCQCYEQQDFKMVVTEKRREPDGRSDSASQSKDAGAPLDSTPSSFRWRQQFVRPRGCFLFFKKEFDDSCWCGGCCWCCLDTVSVNVSVTSGTFAGVQTTPPLQETTRSTAWQTTAQRTRACLLPLSRARLQSPAGQPQPACNRLGRVSRAFAVAETRLDAALLAGTRRWRAGVTRDEDTADGPSSAVSRLLLRPLASPTRRCCVCL